MEATRDRSLIGIHKDSQRRCASCTFPARLRSNDNAARQRSVVDLTPINRDLDTIIRLRAGNGTRRR